MMNEVYAKIASEAGLVLEDSQQAAFQRACDLVLSLCVREIWYDMTPKQIADAIRRVFEREEL